MGLGCRKHEQDLPVSFVSKLLASNTAIGTFMLYGSKQRGLSVARALMTSLLLCCIAMPLRAAEEESRVLMLYGVDPYLPPFLLMDKAVRESLSSKTDGRIAFFSESLDSQRFAVEALEPEIADLLEKKYQALPINVVVAVSRTALDFFERYGGQIWPGARVVYVGFLGHELEPSALPPGASAVLSILDAAGTIDIARRLQPGAHHVVVINGASEIDRTAEQQARDSLATLDKSVTVEFLSGLPLQELLDRLAVEPPESIVIYLAQFRDRDGRPYEPLAVLRAVVKASRAPVYGAGEPYIGLGAIAGSVASYESKGRLAGEQVRRALMGGPPDPSRIVLAAPNRCVADARALQRWSLDKRLLPSDCDIRFAEVPLWRQYLWQIAVTLAIVAAQTVLIVALFAQRRRRRQAEEAELAQRAELTRFARFAMAGELTGAIAHEINQPLGAILSNADAADLLLDSGLDRREDLRAILADIRRDDLRASDVVQRLRNLLGRHKVDRKDLDLNEVARALEPILYAEARRRGVALEVRHAPKSLVIFADEIQVQQVLVNLVLNAMDAVGGESGDRRRVVVSLGEGAVGAVLAVSDIGPGISPENMGRIFESFFTTKDNGMGLGLSITQTIMEAHGGRIRVESSPGKGTTFQAEFPLATAGASSPHPA